MRRILPLLATLLLCATASARIGETLQECEARYGNPIIPGANPLKFAKEGFSITVNFFEGKADAIVFQKLEKPIEGKLDLTQGEIHQLLHANGGGREWVASSNNDLWTTKDGTMQAVLLTPKPSLFISTTAYIERAKAAKEKAEENPNLKGF